MTIRNAGDRPDDSRGWAEFGRALDGALSRADQRLRNLDQALDELLGILANQNPGGEQAQQILDLQARLRSTHSKYL